MRIILLLVGLVFTQNILAQDFDTDEIHNEQLNISGDYERPRTTAADRIRKMRQRLEKRNEAMVQKKIESIRIQKEVEMMKQIRQSMNESLSKINSL